jgi:aquaporin Z
MNIRALLAEFIGTFALLFAGIGAIAADDITGGAGGLVGIALAHGLALVIFISAFGAASGAHFNPAVTIGLWSIGKINVPNAVAYIIAQCLGAFVATWALMSIIPAGVLTTIKWGTPLVNIDGGATVVGALLAEIVLTFFLVAVIYGTAVHERAPKFIGGLCIGLTVTCDILMGGPISGAAMNPARHLAPSVLGGFCDNSWIYWVGPIFGGLLGAQVSKFVLGSSSAS